jgi:8-oxo-dGTP pyrophosphatase MutT (NUDIX family)
VTRSSEPADSRTAFTGSMLGLTLERWGDVEREIVERADSVAVAAVDGDGHVLLVRQFREAARRPLLELPAGTVEEGEEPLAAAQRELAEETRLHARSWRPGPVVFASPGYSRERIHLFVAEDLEPAHADADPGESIELERWPLAAVPGRLGEVEDAKTLAGLLFLIGAAGAAETGS